MDENLKVVLMNIKAKTNIDLWVYSKFSTNTFSTNDIEIIRCDKPIDEIYVDFNIDVTFFTFKYKGDDLIGGIKGATKVEHNYALLIISILETYQITDNINSKHEFIKSLLNGECNDVQTQKYMTKFNVSSNPCIVYIINQEPSKTNDVANLIETFKSNKADITIVIDDITVIYIKFKIKNLMDIEYQTVADYSQFLYHSIEEELNCKCRIGIGSVVKSVQEANLSYNQALSSIRMGKIFASKSNIHTYREYILVNMLESLPKYKLQEFLDILLEQDAKSIFTDMEMLSTAEEFLESSLNVSETSRKLFMHRNTLMYRLDKIARQTGLDIRSFKDSVTFRIITILYKLLA